VLQEQTLEVTVVQVLQEQALEVTVVQRPKVAPTSGQMGMVSMIMRRSLSSSLSMSG
jgi:hypothetical protein